jgi:hypothetical protein
VRLDTAYLQRKINVTNQQTTPDQAVQQIYQYTASLMRSGTKTEVIHQNLVQRGLTDEQANIVLNNLQKARKKALAEIGQRDLLLGGGICLLGIVVTVATFSAAQNGGTYVVAWGAIIFGAIRFFRGLSRVL